MVRAERDESTSLYNTQFPHQWSVRAKWNLQTGAESMWDTKRQIIWLTAGIAFGTFIVYNDARDELGKLDPQVFIFWEIILLTIIGLLFFLYSRKKR